MKLEEALEEMADSFVDTSESLGSKTNSPLFSFETKDGKKYSPAVRKLYYTLLSTEIPPAKIANIVRGFIIFFPSVDVSTLKLPGETCAGYMRKEELKTISAAHQATVLATADGLHLNSDGTTKFQRKLNTAALNGVVLSVTEVSDGKADTVMEYISSQLEKLRNTAKQLGIPNHDVFNWSMLQSSCSDSAAAQKRLLLQQQKDKCIEGSYDGLENEILDIVKSFCGMHLGINLRKAFIQKPASQEDHDNTAVDTFVYEFCKLFGSQGPEYACNIQFKDFLMYRREESDGTKKLYYNACLEVSLARQIGNCYFVTRRNATKILFYLKLQLSF